MDDIVEDILFESSPVKGSFAAPSRPKFQPKAKPRPNKGPSVSVPDVAGIASNELPATSVPVDSKLIQFVQPNDFVDNILDAPRSSSFTESVGTKQTSFSKEACDLDNDLIDENLLAEDGEVIGSAITGHSENFISKSSRDGNLNADTSLELKYPEDVIGQSTITADPPAEMPTLDASTTQIEEEMSAFPDVVCTGTSPLRPCSAQTAHALSTSSMDHYSGHYEETLVSSPGDFQVDMDQGADDSSCREAVDIISQASAVSGKRAVKFQSKPKSQSGRKKDLAHLPDTPKAPFENLSHVGLDGDFSIETTSAKSDTVVAEDIDSLMTPDLPEENGKHGKRKISGALNFFKKSLDIEENVHGYVALDDANDGIQCNSSSTAKALNETTISRDESNDNDYLGEETPNKKRQRKPKIVATEKDKPAGKRRRESKAPDESTVKPPKKFPHATRRKRSVDKSLLEAPEDETDLQRVPIRDLIILAEYKEHQAKKEAAAVQPPSTNGRTDNPLPEDLPDDDDETFGSDQDTGSLHNASTSRVLKDTSYFNYQTYTDRKRVRWSKQDTDLFYQGIRQFGTDFYLIAELFPGRDHKQIKLKYKKEERQHPMMLNDTLSSRAKDHSQFELVIQRLQERAAQKKQEEQDQMSGEDDLIYPTGEEEGPDEGPLETHGTGAKSEQNEDGSAADQEQQQPDTAQVVSPAKLYDSEDDFDFAYQSQF